MYKFTELLIILLFLLPLTVEAGTTVYKTVDKQGKIIFTDQPQQGAEVIELQPLSSFEGEGIDNAVSKNTTSGTPQKYTSLSITQPQPNESIWLGSGDLITTVDLIPPLAKGDKIQILLDGALINESGVATTFQHTNVSRGEHSVKAQVLSKKGNILISSDPVTFYMHRSSVLQHGG